MAKIKYTEHRFSAETKLIVDRANSIIREYAQQGYDLTLRQLYYQFVSRGLIPNKDKEYKRLGSIVSDARMAGQIDWDSITDRTRNLRNNSHWGSGKDILESAARSFAIDKWAGQKFRPEVWIEKDALVGVLESVCPDLDVPYFSCRGYTSQSEMWAAAQRIFGYVKNGQAPVIIHLGDHDPSGIDMSRDIRDRLRTFLDQDWLNREMDLGGEPTTTAGEIREDMEARCGARGLAVRRIALNMDQVRQYSPPPNPAKMTDARAGSYVEEFGDQSWELDALDPATLGQLIRDEIASLRDQSLWDAAVEREEAERKRLLDVARKWKP